jgi:hypothetical protein
MGVATTSLASQAKSIFADLGYSVSNDGTVLKAKRKWRSVTVTCSAPESVPEEGDFRCFVTRASAATDTYRRVSMADPDYEWAVIGVYDDGDYDVYGPSS